MCELCGCARMAVGQWYQNAVCDVVGVALFRERVCDVRIRSVWCDVRMICAWLCFDNGPDCACGGCLAILFVWGFDSSVPMIGAAPKIHSERCRFKRASKNKSATEQKKIV